MFKIVNKKILVIVLILGFIGLAVYIALTFQAKSNDINSNNKSVAKDIYSQKVDLKNLQSVSEEKSQDIDQKQSTSEKQGVNQKTPKADTQEKSQKPTTQLSEKDTKAKSPNNTKVEQKNETAKDSQKEIARVRVDVNENIPQFREITIEGCTYGKKFRIKELKVVREFGKPILISSKNEKTEVFILKEDGVTVLGSVEIEINKDNKKDYTIN